MVSTPPLQCDQMLAIQTDAKESKRRCKGKVDDKEQSPAATHIPPLSAFTGPHTDTQPQQPKPVSVGGSQPPAVRRESRQLHPQQTLPRVGFVLLFRENTKFNNLTHDIWFIPGSK